MSKIAPAPSGSSPTTKSSLTPEHRAELEKAGVLLQEIEALDAKLRNAGKAKKETTSRQEMAPIIVENAPKLIQMGGGKPLLTGRSVGNALISLRLHRPVRGYQGFGDHLGTKNLDLPKVTFRGKCYYDLTFVTAAPEEKEARQEYLSTVPSQVLALLVGEIKIEEPLA